MSKINSHEKALSDLICEYAAMEKRVRRVHKPVFKRGEYLCDGCSKLSDYDVRELYPCETIKALDGDK